MKEIRELRLEDKVSFMAFNQSLWEAKNSGHPFLEPKKIDDFEVYYNKLQKDKGPSKDENYSPVTHYFYFDNGQILARISCRWNLVGDLKTFGGQIGYVTRPDYHNQGIMTELLAFALVKFYKRGNHKVYITALKDNFASQKVIEKSGGIYHQEIESNGQFFKTYWIDLETIFSKPALIWDLDGTLIDSYYAISQALEVVYREFHLPFDKEKVLDYVLKESVGQLLEKLSLEYQLDKTQLHSCFMREQESRDDSIKLLPYAKEILEWTQQKGIRHFMYTHKGKTTDAVLRQLGIRSYFTEVLTGVSGFERKPNPEGIFYLIDKYHLDSHKTYYVGDRKLDLEVALNAGIFSLNLTQANSEINHYIKNLISIKEKLTKTFNI